VPETLEPADIADAVPVWFAPPLLTHLSMLVEPEEMNHMFHVEPESM
jgi:hypothetical protein